ncbi:hypothetical protein Micbo1qcDRAFT_212658 [Microdochium bolleyi]|uniref:FAD-binding PCMH-type domain-containing protein n=1 Tax=Microdochium bolleyi TaxID=196109 RepID=A0A136IX54_9PEZI|nr:hypothetical protein Micbo1qcDRAFT_212658 [Microdochium bolleyi]
MSSQAPAIDFEALRSLVPRGIVLTPGSQEYEDSLQRWSQTCVKRAAVVVKPADAAEVSAAVQFATGHKLPFVVKCGGHATSGVSACEDGMVVDLGLLRSVSVDRAAKTVTFGGGCLWSDVDTALWAHGMATVGGTVADTGVGGLVLGGGFGMLTAQHGLCVDLLLECEVVTADGQVRIARAEGANADLFWALRGAGQNFGVVTRFTARAFDQGRVYSGTIVLPLDALDTLVDFSNTVIDRADPRSTLVFCATHLPPDYAAPGLLAIVFYNGTEAEGRAFFAPLLALALVSTARVMDWPDVNMQLGQVPLAPNWRRLQGGATFVPPLRAAAVREAVLDLFLPAVQAHAGMRETSMILYEILPNAKLRSVPHDATAFAARDDVYHISTIWQWDDPAHDAFVRQANRDVVRKLKEDGIQHGVTQYNNYDMSGPIPPESAFGVNLQRLREVKAKYDPDNVFFKWLSLYPKPAADGV